MPCLNMYKFITQNVPTFLRGSERGHSCPQQCTQCTTAQQNRRSQIARCCGQECPRSDPSSTHAIDLFSCSKWPKFAQLSRCVHINLYQPLSSPEQLLAELNCGLGSNILFSHELVKAVQQHFRILNITHHGLVMLHLGEHLFIRGQILCQQLH